MQDLAQDLDQTASAVDVVARHVRVRDPTVSDERVRTVLGTLGLMQEKAVRLVGLLSGGEKARVALASFVLMPHNLLLLDEPSNHLDITTLKVQTPSLVCVEELIPRPFSLAVYLSMPVSALLQRQFITKGTTLMGVD